MLKQKSGSVVSVTAALAARSLMVSKVRQLGLIVLTTWPAIASNVPFLPDDLAQGTQIEVTNDEVRSDWRI